MAAPAKNKKAKNRNPSTKSRNVVADARGKPKMSRETVNEWARSIIVAVVIFLVVTTLFLQAYRIPSGSMEPTLLVGDFLFANKAIFGAHIPFTHYNLPGFRDPHRGEVVVYESPSQARLAPDLRLKDELTPIVVKRLVGVAGDTLDMRDGMLYVDGIAQRQGFGMGEKPFGYVDTPDSSFDWQIPYGLKESRFGPAPAHPSHDNWGPFVVPPGHFFSMGDNRYESVDARYYGFVPRANIRAKPMFIYMSFDWSDLLVRWSRFGKIIH
jgi:signal peptidase I